MLIDYHTLSRLKSRNNDTISLTSNTSSLRITRLSRSWGSLVDLFPFCSVQKHVVATGVFSLMTVTRKCFYLPLWWYQRFTWWTQERQGDRWRTVYIEQLHIHLPYYPLVRHIAFSWWHHCGLLLQICTISHEKKNTEWLWCRKRKGYKTIFLFWFV